MAEDNESQGLKIAVAAFISLSVILAVGAFFLYSSVESARARLETVLRAEQQNRRALDLAVYQYDELRNRIGTKAAEFDAAKAEIIAHFKNIDERLDKVMNMIDRAVQTAQKEGAQGPELEDCKLKVKRAIESYRSEPNKTCISSLDQLTDAMESLAQLTAQLSLRHADAKKSTEATKSGAKEQGSRKP